MQQALWCGSIIAIWLAIGCLAKRSEAKAYNSGVCTVCNRELRCFDMDSQGGRGYKCDQCHHVVWVSYSVDKVAA